MKKLVPFKKEILFQTHLSEVTSISLEHTLHVENENLISGEFMVSGEYRIADTSINTENFEYKLPFDIHLDDHYLLDHVTVDINDFYYEILNNNALVVNIEVAIDKLSEKPLLEPHQEEIISLEEDIRMDEIKEEKELKEERKVEPIPTVIEETVIPVMEQNTVTSSIFGSFKEEVETYSTYHVYIVREGDTLENILLKYNVTKEECESYNDLQELKPGYKLVIPSSKLVKD